MQPSRLALSAAKDLSKTLSRKQSRNQSASPLSCQDTSSAHQIMSTTASRLRRLMRSIDSDEEVLKLVQEGIRHGDSVEVAERGQVCTGVRSVSARCGTRQ